MEYLDERVNDQMTFSDLARQIHGQDYCRAKTQGMVNMKS